jgi:dipeptidyl aminopeptidase/acylaminoacyl peptidase
MSAITPKLTGFAVLFLIAASLNAQTKHRVTLSDLEGVQGIGAVELSPSGAQVAWSSGGLLSISSADHPDQPPASLGQGKSPTWSPDGRKLAFYSAKSGTLQLWMYDASTHLSKQLPTITGGITASIIAGPRWYDLDGRYSWSPDSRQIVFASQVPKVAAQDTDHSEATGKDAVKPLILDSSTPLAWTLSGIFVSAFGQPNLEPGTSHPKVPPVLTSQLFVVDIQTGTTRQITHDEQGYYTPDWSPDGKTIVCSTSSGREMSGFSLNTTSLVALDVQTGNEQSLTNALGNKTLPTWSPNGKEIAFLTSEHGGRQTIDVLDWGSRTIRQLSEHLPVSVAELRWAPDSNSVFTLALDGVDWRVVRISLRDRSIEAVDTSSPAQRVHLSIAKSGDIAWVSNSGEHPDEVYLRKARASKPQLLIDVNPQIRDWELGQQEVIHWTGGRGEAMEGLLITPPDYQPGKSYPLVVDTYPGIRNSFAVSTILGNQAWASKGYVVFYPDARAPYVWPNHFRTPAFDESAKGPDGFEVTTEQVLSGVDYLIKRGMVDPDRMALLGFSNGGGITNALLSRTNRFRCAVSVAAVYPDWIAPFFLHGYSSLTELSASGDPIMNPENYLKLSSVFRADKVETPILIADGDLDQDFLIGSIEWFNALRWEKKNVTLIRYPGQGHGFHGEEMQDFWARETEFVDQKLKPTP